MKSNNLTVLPAPDLYLQEGSKTNKQIGYRSVQIMHQTVREFFLKPYGYVANSKFKIVKKDAQNCITTACVQYLVLCALNILSVSRPQDVGSWTPNHFEDFAKYLDGRPLAAYALRHLEHHVDRCDQDLNTVISNMSRFIGTSTCVPGVALMGRWIQSRLDKTTLLGQQDRIAAEFRDKLLRTAAKSGFSKATEIILLFGANADAKDNLERTALSYATENGHKDVVTVLLTQNLIDPDARDASQRTPLLIAAEAGHSTIVSLLLGTLGVEPDSRGKHGRTALSYAAERGHEKVVKLLLDHSVKVDAESEWSVSSRSPLSYAAENGHASIVDMLLRCWDIKVDHQDSFGRTPLSYAAEKGHLGIVQSLLARGKPDVNSENDSGRTPLSYAAEYGRETTVRLLLAELKIMVNPADLFGRTPLAYAIAEGNENIVKMLESAGLARSSGGGQRILESRSETDDRDSESGSFTIRIIEDSRE